MDYLLPGQGTSGLDGAPYEAGTSISTEKRNEKKSGFPYMNVLK
jgi:hypothetical protein